MSISVLLIGAGGAFGEPLLRELIHQAKNFETIAILASNGEKASKFEWVREKGIKIRIGSFIESSSYKGWVRRPLLSINPS